MILKMNGEKFFKVCLVMDNGISGFVKFIKLGKGFCSESGENQVIVVISSCDVVYISSLV